MEYRPIPDFQPHLNSLPYQAESDTMRIPSSENTEAVTNVLKDKPYAAKHHIAVCKQESLSFIELPHLWVNGQMDYTSFHDPVDGQGFNKINGKDTLITTCWNKPKESTEKPDHTFKMLSLTMDRQFPEGEKTCDFNASSGSGTCSKVEDVMLQGIVGTPALESKQTVSKADSWSCETCANEPELFSSTKSDSSVCEFLVRPRSPEQEGRQRRSSQGLDKEKLTWRKMKVYSPESLSDESLSSPSLECENIFSAAVFYDDLKSSDLLDDDCDDDGGDDEHTLEETKLSKEKVLPEATNVAEISELLGTEAASQNYKGVEQERRRFSASELINKLQLTQRRTNFSLKLGKSLSTKITAKEKGTHLNQEGRRARRERSFTVATAEGTASVLSLQHPPIVPSAEQVSVRLRHESLDDNSCSSCIKYERRQSRFLPNSVLYQEYSDAAIDREIQRQKWEGTVVEEDEIVPSKSNLSPTNSFRSQRSSRGSAFSLWQDIPDVRSSGLLDIISNQDRKLQEAKFELITSEASYIRSLSIAVEHFMNSKELNDCLGTQEKQWLFSKLPDVKDVSERFLQDLEDRLESDILRFDVCDIVLSHCPEFRRVYLPYVTNQAYQEQTYQKLLQENTKFPSVLAKLEEDQVCQRLPLTSFLILPFQRITRLKMLVENILKQTTQGSRDEDTATKAFNELKKIIKECNASVQSMKRTEELIRLNNKIHFESKIFPLISQSRWLVKHGELTEVDTQSMNVSGSKFKLSTRMVYLHLFNDCLLLSRKKETGKFAVFVHAKIQDLKVKDLSVKLHGMAGHIFHLQLFENQQLKYQILLKALTESEKQRWISAMFPSCAEPAALQMSESDDAPQVQCIKAYKAQEHDELTLEKADIMEVRAKTSDGWIEGIRLSDGESGWFPKQNVEEIVSRNARLRNLRENNRIKCATQKLEEEHL
ncbi:rho guanine nucleotide exchange factor 19-like [Protopterus annectens]|uniref:rho guanine nucleotide exchange factor 19-like n=1 Tax=Protopterus annectens TaxID=7888 RepID=UPI001CF9468F|nr:rho guanine nucleotide exchange factor 19-like [Protopterus annectens]